MILKRFWLSATAASAAAALAGCATHISPEREDFVIVDGRLSSSGGDWVCGTVARESDGYFYVCDMDLEVRRVVFGRHPEKDIRARFFFLETDRADEIVTGPHIEKDRRAAAILWQRPDGPHSFILMKFPGRWCVPDWIKAEIGLSDEEVARLDRAGYPLCSVSPGE